MAVSEKLKTKFERAYTFLDLAHSHGVSEQAWRYAVERCIYVLTFATRSLAETYVQEQRGIRVQRIGEIGKALVQYGLLSESDQAEWIGMVAIGEQIAEVSETPDEAVVRALISVGKYRIFRKVYDTLMPLL